jgi:small subunit ribosomal protein S21
VAEVKLGPGESFENLLRRFNRQVQEGRILAEIRRRRFYEKPSVGRKKKQAVRKWKSSR